MAWYLLVAVAVITLSVSVLLQRILMHKDKSDPVAYAIVFQATVALLVGIYAVISGFHAPDFARLWPYMLLTFGLFGAGHVVYARTLQRVEASVFTTLFATQVLWTVLAAVIFIGERPSLTKLLGALLIFLSVVVLTERTGRFKLDKGVVLGLFTGVLFGLAAATWAYVGKFSDAASWNTISFAGPAMFILLVSPRSLSKAKPLLQGNTFKRLLALAIFFSISSLALLKAFQAADVSRVAPLFQTQIIVTMALGTIFLRERSRVLHKVAASAVCFLGVVLLV